MGCAICGGELEEHATSRHVYTEDPGNLMTREQQKKKQQKGTTVAVDPSATSATLARLIEVLVARGSMSPDEAVYVLTGLNEPPLVRLAKVSNR